jgi:hypothetical protein
MRPLRPGPRAPAGNRSPRDEHARVGRPVRVFRLAFGLDMASCLVLGVVAIRRGGLDAQRAWRMRAYALAACGRRAHHRPSQGRAGHAGQRHGRVLMARAGRGLPARYVFRIDGHLDTHWSAWFDDLEVSHQDDGTTMIAGLVQDQAQLHGLLAKIRDLGVTLIQLDAVEDPD